MHSWDLARALGVPVGFPDELTAAALPVAEAVPDGPARLRPGAAFAPALDRTGRSALDDILAHLGRRPDWSPRVS
ncbi:hypothetical protein MF672_016675 [Actinomadura sp. ATCC 31491]|uniref:TIGR03086 family protein n=1 Tax=Actinomadura luzonensis TaxID=2805427 RepID=A0ABT0FST7_9ACTN|nr:hypothetical protein [Actinomadura luzonensis]MCK2215411.1 hypothetical protein [Actinomadura luzonensis]